MQFLTDVVSRAGGREANEDYCHFLLSDGLGCWVVADGLGGHFGGELAAKAAVDAVLASFAQGGQVSEQALRRYLEAARDAVINLQTQQPDMANMRTTIVVLVASSTEAIWAHMGDSRLYYFEDGEMIAQTRDDSVVQRMVEAGELSPGKLRHHPDRNRLLRCIGTPDEEFRPTIRSSPSPFTSGSAFLLCTDGFWDNVLETEMKVDLAKASTPADWLTLMEDRLLVRLADGDDNYSGIGVMLSP